MGCIVQRFELIIENPDMM